MDTPLERFNATMKLKPRPNIAKVYNRTHDIYELYMKAHIRPSLITEDDVKKLHEHMYALNILIRKEDDEDDKMQNV